MVNPLLAPDRICIQNVQPGRTYKKSPEVHTVRYMIFVFYVANQIADATLFTVDLAKHDYRWPMIVDAYLVHSSMQREQVDIITRNNEGLVQLQNSLTVSIVDFQQNRPPFPNFHHSLNSSNFPEST